MSAKRLRGVSVAAYFVAGTLLGDPDLTAGQRKRLTELLLTVLSEPDRFSGPLVAGLARMAIEP